MYLKNKTILLLLFSLNQLVYPQSLLQLKTPITDNISFINIADNYYLNQKYRNSLLFYEYIYQNDNSKNIKIQLKPKILLSYLRLKESYEPVDENHIKDYLIEYNDFVNFPEYYIDLYSSLRFGYNGIAFTKINKILSSNSIPQEQKDYAKLIFGSIYFDENIEEAENYYNRLYEESKTSEVKNIAKSIINETHHFKQNLQEKNPWIAGILSGILPGTGYFYTNHYTDGLISLFWNATFLGGGIYMYQLEKQTHRSHIISYGFLIMGLTTYISNILGSYTSATRYNNYKLRIFYQKLRQIYFNTNFVEKTSGIQFEVNY
jgi:hypothetical protein